MQRGFVHLSAARHSPLPAGPTEWNSLSDPVWNSNVTEAVVRAFFKDVPVRKAHRAH